MIKWVAVAGLLAAVSIVLLFPLAPIWLAPICRVFEAPVHPGDMHLTARGTVMCSTPDAMSHVARAKSMVDLPPFVLINRGCFPAPNRLVKVVRIDGDLAGVRLPRSSDRSREWWITLASRGASLEH